LTVRRTETGLRFRLWEIKKHSGDGGISGTTKRAYDQLKNRGLEYLAEYSNVEQHTDDPDLARLYATLPEHWLDASESAGAGVAVVCSQPPVRCFTTFPRHFPALSDSHGRMGVAAAFGDLADFTRRVRAAVWTGL
jgi:hypothetical protein